VPDLACHPWSSIISSVVREVSARHIGVGRGQSGVNHRLLLLRQRGALGLRVVSGRAFWLDMSSVTGRSRTRRASGLACTGEERCKRVPEELSILGAEVDLVVLAVQGESDGLVGLAAVEVVKQQDFDTLGHDDGSSFRRS
jgi:hypothetical protein